MSVQQKNKIKFNQGRSNTTKDVGHISKNESEDMELKKNILTHTLQVGEYQDDVDQITF